MNNREALKIIDEMIASAKNDIKDNGFHFLLWGWLIIIACISEYILLYEVEWHYHWIGWPVTSIIGGVTSGIYGFRNKRKAKVKTHFDSVIGYVWGGFGVTLFLVLFSMNINEPSGVYPLVIAIYSMGTFISGALLKFTPLKVGAIISWCIALTAMFTVFKFQLLLLAVSIIIAYLIPGYILKSKYSN